MRKGPQMGTCFESRTQESLLAFAFHFRKSGATLEAALAFPEIQCFEGFEPRTLRLLLFLRNSSDLELLSSVEYLAACLYLEEGGAPPGVGGILGFGGSRDAWKGPRSCMIPTLLVISGSPGITRNDEIDHDQKPFLGFGGSLDPPNPRKGTCFESRTGESLFAFAVPEISFSQIGCNRNDRFCIPGIQCV